MRACDFRTLAGVRAVCRANEILSANDFADGVKTAWLQLGLVERPIWLPLPKYSIIDRYTEYVLGIRASVFFTRNQK